MSWQKCERCGRHTSPYYTVTVDGELNLTLSDGSVFYDYWLVCADCHKIRSEWVNGRIIEEQDHTQTNPA